MWRLVIALLIAWALASTVVCVVTGDPVFAALNLVASVAGIAFLVWVIRSGRV